MMARAAPGEAAVVAGARARARSENPVLLHYLFLIGCATLLVATARGSAQLLGTAALAAILTTTGITWLWLWAGRRFWPVRASVERDVLCLRGSVTRLRVHPKNVARLRIEHEPPRVNLVLCDGRLVTVDGIDPHVARAFETAVLGYRGSETFELAGIPKLGAVTGALSSLFVVSGLVHPRLRIANQSLCLKWGPFRFECPWSQLAGVAVTAKGVVLSVHEQRTASAKPNLRQVELQSYGGLGMSFPWSTVELNGILEERIVQARRRALRRPLSGYRERSGSTGSG